MPMTLSKRIGLTVIELLIVLGILGILGLFLTRDVSQILSRSHFTNTVERITRTLRTAQIYSISGRNGSAWGVHYETGKLVLFKGADYSARDISFDASVDIPLSVVITGWNDIYFDRLRGTPSTPVSIVVESQGRAGTISVNAQGGINRP